MCMSIPSVRQREKSPQRSPSIPLSTLNAQPPELKLCFKAWTQPEGASVL
jgi:hypothetical protein